MNINIDISLFHEICRLCLNKLPSSDASFLMYESSIDSFSLDKLLNQFFQIEVKKDDNLPQKVCTDCIFNLGQIHNFYKQCTSSRETLLNIVAGINEQGDDKYVKILPKLPFMGQGRELINIKEEKIEKSEIPLICKQEIKKIKRPIKNQNKNPKITTKVVKKEEANDNIKSEEIIEPESVKIEEIRNDSENPERPIKRNDKGEPLECIKCSLIFPYHNHYRMHIRTHENPHQCPHCHRTFKMLVSLNNHLQKIHKGANLKCNKDGRPIQCEICLKICSSYHTYRQHKYEHSEQPKPCICPQCGKGFLTTSILKKHLYSHSNERPVLCTQCPKRFKNELGLTLHMKIVHTEEAPTEQELKCPTCDRVFNSIKKWKNHKTKHFQNPGLCSICGKYLTRRAQWKVHMRMHTGEKPYNCEYCGEGFSRSEQLKYHINTHTGEEPYPCQTCGKTFTTPRLRQNHKKKYHANLHKCTYCNKVFLRENNFINHLKSHEVQGEKMQKKNVKVMYVEDTTSSEESN